MKWLFADISDFSEQQYKDAYEKLTENRKKKIDRLVRPEDKMRSLAAEMLLNRLLASEFGLQNAILENEQNGRPFIKDCPVFVSLSHSGQKVAAAASKAPVGIDVERLRPANLKMARIFCTEEEKIYLFGARPSDEDYNSCSDEDVLARFYEVWTAKEAYFKKLGTGITDLKSVNVLALKREMSRIEDYVVQIICDE